MNPVYFCLCLLYTSEWVTEGKPHLVEKLPVGEELILREITAPEGYEIAEDVKFTLEDTMEVQRCV